MTRTKHLERIKKKCERLIELYSVELYKPIHAIAGWKATIAAIDVLLSISQSETYADEAHGCDHPSESDYALDSILSAWPEELL